MSVSVNAIVAAVGSDLVGRECFLPARGVVGVVESVGAGGALTVVVDGRREEGVAGVVVLPRLGESVWLARGGGEPVAGLWIGLRAPLPASGQEAAGQPAGGPVAGGSADQPVTARVLVDGVVVEHTAQPSAFDARAVVLTLETPAEAQDAPAAPDGALRALAQLAGTLDTQTAEHAGWKDRFAAAAGTKADELDLCGQFDEFMSAWGLPGRTRTYAVRVSTTEDVTVYVQAAGEDEAEAQVTGELVDEARSAAGMRWQIEYTERD